MSGRAHGEDREAGGSRAAGAAESVTIGGEEYLLRRAGAEDAERLHQLDMLCFPSGRAFTEGYFMLLFLYHRAFGWILERAGGERQGPASAPPIVAFILLTSQRQKCNVSTIDVHPDCRRRGLATRLFRLAEQEMEEKGVAKCTLQVAVSNTAAIRLYHQLGFRKARTLHGYYGGREDGYLMEKRFEPRRQPACLHPPALIR